MFSDAYQTIEKCKLEHAVLALALRKSFSPPFQALLAPPMFFGWCCCLVLLALSVGGLAVTLQTVEPRMHETSRTLARLVCVCVCVVSSSRVCVCLLVAC